MKKIAFVASCTLLLSACSAMTNSGWSKNNQELGLKVNTYMLHAEDNKKFAAVKVGDEINLAYSPWAQGNNQIALKVTKTYFAASGRQCVRAAIQSNAASQTVNPEQAIICNYADSASNSNANQWGITPALGGKL